MSEVVERAFDAAEKSHWQIKTLGDVCRTSSGGTPSRSRPDFFNGNIPWVKSGELTDGLVSEVSEFISEEALAGSSAKLLPAGTLLIAMYGATVGKLGVLARGAATNQAVCAIFPPPELDPKFLFWYLRRQRSHLIAKAVGGAQPNISQTILRDLELLIPPIGEQREIVAEIEKQFSRLDEAVANLQRVKANLKRYKASVLKAAVEGRLVETEASLAQREGRSYETGEQLLRRTIEARSGGGKARRGKADLAAMPCANVKEVPDGWVWTTTGQVCECIVPNRDKPKTFSGDIPWLTLPDFDDSEITVARSRSGLGFTESEVALYRAKAIPADSVVMSCVGRFGISAVLTKKAVINQQLHAFLPSEGVAPKYLAYVLRTREQEMLEKSTATTIAYLNKENCNSISVPLPPLAEQTRIVAEVDRHLSIIREVEAEIDINHQRAQALRQATLAKFFSPAIY